MNDMGQPDQKLKRNINGNLELRYSSQQNVTGCTVHPSTAIEFICPKKGGVRYICLDCCKGRASSLICLDCCKGT